MKVKCILCEKLETIEDDSIMAKKLRNRPIHTYMCQECYDRVAENTKSRIAARETSKDKE